MMTAQVHATIEHDIGATGSVVIQSRSGDVIVRAIEGETVRVRGLGDRDLEDDYRIHATPGQLEITAIDHGFVREFLSGAGDSGPIDVEMPRGASLTVEDASGEIRVTGVTGEQRLQTASGDVSLDAVEGTVSIEAVSGDVRLRAIGPVDLRARTVSGNLDVVAPSFTAAHVTSTSGDAQITGTFAGPGPYLIATVSGDTLLAPGPDIRVEGSTVSGEVGSDLHHRSSGFPGRRTIEVGSGGSLVRFQSISGNLRVLSDELGGQPRPVRPSMPPPPAAATPPVPPAVPTVPAVPSKASPATTEPDDPNHAVRLAILEDLEQGRIGVDEASQSLADLDSTDAAQAAPPVVLEASGHDDDDDDDAWVRRV